MLIKIKIKFYQKTPYKNEKTNFRIGECIYNT